MGKTIYNKVSNRQVLINDGVWDTIMYASWKWSERECFFPQRCKAFRSKVWPCFLWTWGSLDGKIIYQGSPRNKELIDQTITGLVATARNYFRACSNPMLSVISTGQKWMTIAIIYFNQSFISMQYMIWKIFLLKNLLCCRWS